MSNGEGRKRRQNFTAAADRISSLPDAILHEILARLPSEKDTAKAAVLSNRWTHLWRSYPILEFQSSGHKNLSSERAAAAAALKKFSQLHCMQALRVRILDSWEPNSNCHSAFLDDALNLAAENSAQEIDINFCPYRIPGKIVGQLRRLKVLKLQGCYFPNLTNFDNNNSFANSLRVLSLYCVKFPDNRILNCLIEAASLLEDLKLGFMREKIQVRNHQNLKAIEIRSCCGERDGISITEIIGLGSLEILRLHYCSDIQVSLTPNLRELHLEHVDRLELMPVDEKLGTPDMTALPISLSWTTKNDFQFVRRICQLKQHLVFLRQFRQNVHLTIQVAGRVSLGEDRDLIKEEPIPIIECLQVKSSYLDTLIDIVFSVCRPKALLCSGMGETVLCKQLIERESSSRCAIGCKCWRHRLKGVKMTSSARNGIVKEDEMVELSLNALLSGIGRGKQICWFILTWE